MIILFGLRRIASRLGMTFMMCGHCQTPSAHPVTRVRRWFTLFFIPIIPLGTKYGVTCTMCGRSTVVSKEAAESYLGQGDQTAPVPAAPPTGLPVAGVPLAGLLAVGAPSTPVRADGSAQPGVPADSSRSADSD
jgi:hypothetical protein